jgi:hypothetical protein
VGGIDLHTLGAQLDDAQNMGIVDRARDLSVECADLFQGIAILHEGMIR